MLVVSDLSSSHLFHFPSYAVTCQPVVGGFVGVRFQNTPRALHITFAAFRCI